MKKSTPNKVSSTQNQTQSAASVKKETSISSPQKIQSASSKVPAKSEATKGPESQKQASPATAQKVSHETQKTPGSQKPDETSQTAHKQSSATPAPQKDAGGLFGFGAAKTETAKPEESVTGKMFGFGSSFFSSASTMLVSAVQDPKTTPPVSPKMASAKESKPPANPKSEQEKKQQPQQTRTHSAGHAKSLKGSSETPQDVVASHGVSKPGQAACPLCKMVLNMGSKDPPNYNTCTECKSMVCNQCGFNPMPNVTEVRHMNTGKGVE